MEAQNSEYHNDFVEENILYGGLFKMPFFKRSRHSLAKGWTKRFFMFNKRNMVLQYWQCEEERYFKSNGCVRGRPNGSLSMLTIELTVERGEPEHSMFGVKYPIIVSNAPGFRGKKLILASTSPEVQEAWLGTFVEARELLKERIKMEWLKKIIVRDTSDPNFYSLENQYRILIQKGAELKDMEEKIKVTEMNCALMTNKDKMLYMRQEQLRKAHRDVEDKLWALDCSLVLPQNKFRYIKQDNNDFDADYPAGAWGSLTDPSQNNEDLNHAHLMKIKLRLKRMKEAQQDPEHPFHDLTNEDYYPNFSENVIVDQTGKHFDESKKVYRNDDTTKYKIKQTETSSTKTPMPKPSDFKQHEVRKLSSHDTDPEMLSLANLKIFDLIKRENKRSTYQTIKGFLDSVDAPRQTLSSGKTRPSNDISHLEGTPAYGNYREDQDI